MSRSYRKNLVVRDNERGMKRVANKRVRGSSDIPNGGSYRKCFDSYNVRDWTYRLPSDYELSMADKVVRFYLVK